MRCRARSGQIRATAERDPGICEQQCEQQRCWNVSDDATSADADTMGQLATQTDSDGLNPGRAAS